MTYITFGYHPLPKCVHDYNIIISYLLDLRMQKSYLPLLISATVCGTLLAVDVSVSAGGSRATAMDESLPSAGMDLDDPYSSSGDADPRSNSYTGSMSWQNYGFSSFDPGGPSADPGGALEQPTGFGIHYFREVGNTG